MKNGYYGSEISQVKDWQLVRIFIKYFCVLYFNLLLFIIKSMFGYFIYDVLF